MGTRILAISKIQINLRNWCADASTTLVVPSARLVARVSSRKNGKYPQRSRSSLASVRPFIIFMNFLQKEKSLITTWRNEHIIKSNILFSMQLFWPFGRVHLRRGNRWKKLVLGYPWKFRRRRSLSKLSWQYRRHQLQPLQSQILQTKHQTVEWHRCLPT